MAAQLKQRSRLSAGLRNIQNYVEIQQPVAILKGDLARGQNAKKNMIDRGRSIQLSAIYTTGRLLARISRCTFSPISRDNSAHPRDRRLGSDGLGWRWCRLAELSIGS